MPIQAFKNHVFGEIWPPNITFYHRDPQKALPYAKARVLSHKRCSRLRVRYKVFVYGVPKKKKQYVLPNNDSTWFTVLNQTELQNKTNIY